MLFEILPLFFNSPKQKHNKKFEMIEIFLTSIFLKMFFIQGNMILLKVGSCVADLVLGFLWFCFLMGEGNIFSQETVMNRSD